MTNQITYLTDESIGLSAFEQTNLENFSFTVDDWIAQALYNFNTSTGVPDAVQWIPQTAEIVGPERYSGDTAAGIWKAEAVKAMDFAFQHLAAGYAVRKEEDDIDLWDRTNDALGQLTRYAGHVASVEVLDVLDSLTRLNDDVANGRHIDCIKEEVERMKGLLDALVAGYDN